MSTWREACRTSIAETSASTDPLPAPAGMNWDAWVGPAKMVEYSHFQQRRWFWLSNFASGDIANQVIHQVDVIRWGLGLDTHPTKIQSMGGRFAPAADDDADTPNSQTSSCQWAGRNVLVSFEIRHWYTGGESGIGEKYPYLTSLWEAVGVIFFGTKGYMIIPDLSSYHTYLGPTREPGPFVVPPPGTHGMMDAPHLKNWIQAMRSRQREDLNADVEQGHLSTAICHMAKISCRLGWTLNFDPKNERFIGDDDANRLLKREYRTPYVIADIV